MTTATAVTIMVLSQALFVLVVAGILVVVAVALVKLNKKLDQLTNIAEPVAVKITDTLDQVQRATESVSEKADQILTRGVVLTDSVSENVERTAEVVRHTVTTPLIKLSSVIAGVSKTISVYAGHSNGHVDRKSEKE
ncbi:MAG: hypothetical protein ACLQVD_06125 [Capsulimonadaceae bacterium]